MLKILTAKSLKHLLGLKKDGKEFLNAHSKIDITGLPGRTMEHRDEDHEAEVREGQFVGFIVSQDFILFSVLREHAVFVFCNKQDIV